MKMLAAMDKVIQFINFTAPEDTIPRGYYRGQDGVSRVVDEFYRWKPDNLPNHGVGRLLPPGCSLLLGISLSLLQQIQSSLQSTAILHSRPTPLRQVSNWYIIKWSFHYGWTQITPALYELRGIFHDSFLRSHHAFPSLRQFPLRILFSPLHALNFCLADN